MATITIRKLQGTLREKYPHNYVARPPYAVLNLPLVPSPGACSCPARRDRRSRSGGGQQPRSEAFSWQTRPAVDAAEPGGSPRPLPQLTSPVATALVTAKAKRVFLRAGAWERKELKPAPEARPLRKMSAQVPGHAARIIGGTSCEVQYAVSCWRH